MLVVSPAPSNVTPLTPRFKGEFCVSGGSYRNFSVNSTHRTPRGAGTSAALPPVNSPLAFGLAGFSARGA